MNKTELIEQVAQNCEIMKTTAANAVNTVFAAIAKKMAAGEDVTLIGFGTFSTAKRKARDGKNPRTGEKIKIPARRVPVFRAGSRLKTQVNRAKSRG